MRAIPGGGSVNTFEPAIEFVARNFRNYPGWIKVWRQIFHNDIWHSCPHSWFRVFFALLASANYEDQETRVNGVSVKVPAGSMTLGTIEFATFCGISRQQLRSALDYLVQEKIITISATTRYTIVTICNWETYQSDDDASSQVDNQVVASGITSRVTTSKEVKNKRTTTQRVFDPLVEDLAGRLHARHPAHRRGSISEVKQQIKKILEMHAKDEHLSVVERINTNHTVACASHEWQKDDAQFAKGLVNWLAPTKGRWEEAPRAAAATASVGGSPKKLLTTELYGD